ncbi:SRPBCC domain-containing protein [Brevundimonas sp.]|uniref:SRPBCC domain-containing protein n=1 Tax=Brevundimonas sp. TaxID=1871086 RepID=UPI003BAB9302
MNFKFQVSARIARPVAETFEAVADPAKLSRYFTTGGAVGRLEAGKTVHWEFADFPGAFPVQVVEVVANERIVLSWEANRACPMAMRRSSTRATGPPSP